MRLPAFLVRPSLRSRLTFQAGFVILIAALISAISFLLFTLQESAEDMNGSLLHKARAIARILAETPSESDATPLIKTLLSAEPDYYFAEIRDGKGHVHLLKAHSTVPLLISPNQTPPAAPLFATKKIRGRDFSVLYFPGQDLIAIAAAKESITEMLRNAVLLYVILAGLLLIVVVWGARWLAGRALTPIVQLADASASITSFETTQRLPTSHADEEIHRLASVLNAMLDRLQANFSLVRRFTADAAHEIKTPLAIIQGHLESTLHSATFAPKDEDTLLLVQREVARLHRLVDGLLLLSRSDAGQLTLDRTSFDLSLFLNDLWSDAEILAAPLQLRLESHIAPGITINADASQLRQVFLNLLDNACKYNVLAGTVSLRLSSEFQRIQIDIGNTGPAIPAAAAPHIFDRLQRADASRSRAPISGLGLGLSIAREILLAHGGTISLLESQNGWTLFRVTLFNLPS